MKILLPVIVILLISYQLFAADSVRFVEKKKLPTGEMVVVTEGDFEARSIGSLSVRVYEPASQLDETTFFISGLIHARDGSIEKIILNDLNNDQQTEIIITTRSAGTGGYLSAYAFMYSENELIFLTSVEGLQPDADPLVNLKEKLQEKQ